MGFSIAHMGFTSRKSRKKGRVTRGLLCVSPVLAACVTYESGMVAIMDFPHEDKPVWVLGRQYNLRRERHEAQCDVRSRLWMTYRKGFSHIGKCYDIVEVSSNYVVLRARGQAFVGAGATVQPTTGETRGAV